MTDGCHLYQVMEYAPFDLFSVVMCGKMARPERRNGILQKKRGGGRRWIWLKLYGWTRSSALMTQLGSGRPGCYPNCSRARVERMGLIERLYACEAAASR